jgi:hypothetical protein
MDDGEHTGAGKATDLVDREGLQPFLNESTGAGFVKSQLGVGMQIPALANHLILHPLYLIKHRHASLICAAISMWNSLVLSICAPPISQASAETHAILSPAEVNRCSEINFSVDTVSSYR